MRFNLLMIMGDRVELQIIKTYLFCSLTFVLQPCELCPNLGGIFKETDAGRWFFIIFSFYFMFLSWSGSNSFIRRYIYSLILLKILIFCYASRILSFSSNFTIFWIILNNCFLLFLKTVNNNGIEIEISNFISTFPQMYFYLLVAPAVQTFIKVDLSQQKGSHQCWSWVIWS